MKSLKLVAWKKVGILADCMYIALSGLDFRRMSLVDQGDVNVNIKVFKFKVLIQYDTNFEGTNIIWSFANYS